MVQYCPLVVPLTTHHTGYCYYSNLIHAISSSHFKHILSAEQESPWIQKVFRREMAAEDKSVMFRICEKAP